MSSSQIEINFQAAQMQAKKLEDIADDMKRLADQQLANTIQEMSACWKGEAATAYFGKADKVKQDIAATAKTLHTIAASIREEAKRIYDAEMKAVALAQSNSNNL